MMQHLRHAMSIGDDLVSITREENGQFYITVDSVSRTVGIYCIVDG